MHGDKADAAFSRSGDTLFDRFADIQHLGVKKDLLVPGQKLVDQPVEPGGELQPRSEFEKGRDAIQLVDQQARLGDRRHVEGDDQTVFDPLGNFAAEGDWTHVILPAPSDGPRRPVSPRPSLMQEGAMAKQQITSDRLGRPSGHFSQATMIEAQGRLVFISGLTSRRSDGTIAGVGDIEAQTRQVCDNLKAAAEAAGGTIDDICRVDVYVRNMEHFEVIHKVRREYFKAPLPASTMVEVTKMTSPDYLIEISAIAVIP